MNQFKGLKENEKYYVGLQYLGQYANDEDKIDSQEMRRIITESIKSFCDDQLYSEIYDISLGKPYYDIKKIILYLNVTHIERINNIYLDVSGTRVAFKKKTLNIYAFEPVQPLPCRYCINTDYNIIIDMNETKDMFLNKLILNIEFMNNDINPNISIKRMVELKILYEINQGVARFIQL